MAKKTKDKSHQQDKAVDILPHLSLTAAALVSGKEGDSFYAACKG